MRRILLLIMSLMVVAFTPIFGQDMASNEDQQLLDMLEEEKLAKEVYQAFFKKWEHHSFQNISMAEQRHLDKVKQLAENRGLKIPSTVTNDETGVFRNQEFQKLYDELMERGNKSLIDALQVGALIEETDIRDLKMAIAGTQDAQAIKIFTSLMKGSENHLRAFTKNLDRQGVNYAPVVLNREAYEAILTGEKNCSGACCQKSGGEKKGNCKGGKGKGKGGASN